METWTHMMVWMCRTSSLVPARDHRQMGVVTCDPSCMVATVMSCGTHLHATAPGDCSLLHVALQPMPQMLNDSPSSSTCMLVLSIAACACHGKAVVQRRPALPCSPRSSL